MQTISNHEPPYLPRRPCKRSMMYRASSEPTLKREFMLRTSSDPTLVSSRRNLKKKRYPMMVQILPTCFEDVDRPSLEENDPFALEKCCKHNACPPRRRGSSEIDMAAIVSLAEPSSEKLSSSVMINSINAKTA